MNMSRPPIAFGLVVLLGAFSGAALRQDRDVFDHEKHQKVFPECTGCHAGIVEPGRPLYPSAESCANCHDGTVEKKVNWSAPPSRPSNFRFTHAEHVQKGGDHHGRRAPAVDATDHITKRNFVCNVLD